MRNHHLALGTPWGKCIHEARHHPLYAVDNIASLWAFHAFHALCADSIILLFLQAKKPRRN